MPARKKTARNRSGSRARSKASVGAQSTAVAADPKCNLPNICAYLEGLNIWLEHFYTDYKALRIAVCNVEKQAFMGTGVDAMPPRFCSGAPNEPADLPSSGY